jgi:hypothetical protein
MHRIASIILITLVLVACGGGDDDDDDASSSDSAPTVTVASAAPTSGDSSSAGSTQPAAVPSAPAPTEPTTSEPTPTEPAAAASEPTPTAASDSDTESLDGAPTQASSDFPDVQVPLEAGSSGEVASMDPDPFSDTSSLDPESKVKVTINEIMDPAEIGGTIFSPEPGNRWYALNMTMEATGSAIANTGVWELVTTDGTEYTNIFVLGDMPEISYGSIEPGATTEGLITFEIPEDATVQWVLMSPTIFVGGNLVFVN